MNKAVLYTCALALSLAGKAQEQKVFTSDIDHFWTAYDSIQTTADTLRQLHYIQTLYIDKGTEGLKAFMKARDYTPQLWVKLIRQYPKFWASIRPNTLAVKGKAAQIEKSIEKLQELYPQLRPARMYFTIGGLRSGGTTSGDMVLIGAEIATGDPQTDVSQFPNKWLAGVFKEQKLDNIIALNIHEFVHTQQKPGGFNNLLSAAIREGACDFITELVMGAPLPNNYIQYGRAHEPALKEEFKQFMFSKYNNHWMYNGSAEPVADLGYFMGYAICKSYYNNAGNKKKAIRDIIELNYTEDSVERFFKDSKYYTGTLDKEALLKSFEQKRPSVLRVEPFANGDTLVDASIKELRIVFSKPMNPQSTTIGYSPKGKDLSPIAGVDDNYTGNNTTLTIRLDMKPGREYEFVLSDRGFCSAEGFPLKPLTIRFKTKG
jgi:hypothetical protein